MNRLRISEGGQPVYLEDLQLIQDNQSALMAALVSALTDRTGVCWLYPQQMTLEGDTNGIQTKTYAANTLVVDGVLYPMQQTTMQVAEDATLYVCIKDETTTERLFEDGVTRGVRTVGSAYLSESTAGALRSWQLDKVDCLINLLTALVNGSGNWENVNALLMSPYSGFFQMRSIAGGTDYEYLMNFTPTGNEWDNITSEGQAMFLWLRDSEVRERLTRRRTKNQVSSTGVEYYIRFVKDYAYFVLVSEGDIKTVVPPINFTFRESDLILESI